MKDESALVTYFKSGKEQLEYYYRAAHRDNGSLPDPARTRTG